MKSFINDSFMINNKVGEKLYNDYAKDMPIFDYHCHLSSQAIAENKSFANITELMLGGDHYKWRALRSNGIDEEYITGSASDYDKFMAWAKTVPYTIGNPLYHWTHLELKRYFNIDEQLSPKTADYIWNTCNELLKSDDFKTKQLIAKSNVDVICTTDDPIDSLEFHQKIKTDDSFKTKVLPTFRPDKAVEISKDTFLPYLKQLGDVKTFDELCSALLSRINYFHQNGCRLADHGLEYVPFGEGNAEVVFNKAVKGEKVTRAEEEIYKTAVLKLCGTEYAKRGWTMQLHIGALRNNNTKMFNKLGADTGFDSINDLCIADPLSRFLNSLEFENNLPKTILYTLNPKDDYVLATMLGNFQGSGIAGKIQFGSGWWFNDQRDGMVKQLKSLSNLGMLSRFVGMLTDSRSFISYPRHEYFRRILCNLIGEWVEKGEYPEDYEILGEIVKGICYNNALDYFGL